MDSLKGHSPTGVQVQCRSRWYPLLYKFSSTDDGTHRSAQDFTQELGKAQLCAPPRLSAVSQTLPLKQQGMLCKGYQQRRKPILDAHDYKQPCLQHKTPPETNGQRCSGCCRLPQLNTHTHQGYRHHHHHPTTTDPFHTHTHPLCFCFVFRCRCCFLCLRLGKKSGWVMVFVFGCGWTFCCYL